MLDIFIPTVSWKKPLLIASLVLVAVALLVIASLCWYRYRKRLRERRKVNEKIGTWRQESAPRGRGQREEESREHKENLEYSRLKYVGSPKDSTEAGKTAVMV